VPAAGGSNADRYRRAASDALKMLDWCIWYFRYENQAGIATRLERNRDHIRERLTDEPDRAPRTSSGSPVRKMLKAIGLKPE
jgi:hypothetical protein